MKQILKKRKDIAFYIILYPLKIHKDAQRKAESIMCEKDGKKARKMLDDAFKGRPVPDPSCNNDTVKNNIALAKKLGITGTPAIIFSDGRLVRGYLKADKLIKLLEKK
ncbi:thiol:disulfide interchange protein DsbC precursor [bacterium BMS3Abin07]|nr:thiol:disulfide interchange protein DsbC precursor [bacterium BMS3Abin07]GBE33152.1 thiol:disulfide interchange protein DsbC precursor [bacterium BMS3Bbin05]HDL20411.1 hypothetical protein [Nitrospirota bacterium]HDO22636.1 hypothetical protein [Nitrospirota bacterium]HDZ87640.1 hypothetical protein [Nitrospirota bacterium]